LMEVLGRYKARHGHYPRSLRKLTEHDWDGDPEELQQMKTAKSSNSALDEYAYFYHCRNGRQYTLQVHPQMRRANGTYRYHEGALTLYTVRRGRLQERQISQPRIRVRSRSTW
jgi:hypothetical protein